MNAKNKFDTELVKNFESSFYNYWYRIDIKQKDELGCNPNSSFI